MIVRDEEHHLAECLELAGRVVDEIVVVDTGSVDGSVDIAVAAGAKVEHVVWTDDFAAARNAALDLATSDWILYLDADERVVAGLDDGDLRHLSDPAVVAARCRFSVHPDFTRFWELRLFRNRPDIRYEGRIHETMLPSVARLEALGHRVVRTALTIDHLGYIGDRTRKHERNLPLLEAQVVADPARAFLWYELGSARLGLGDHAGAAQAWQAGVDLSRSRPAARPVDVLCYAALAVHGLERARERPGSAPAELAAVRQLIDEMRERLPASHQLDWVEANLALAERRWVEALRMFDALTRVDPDGVVDPQLAFERDIFRAGAYHGVGACLFELDCAAEAAEWFAKAERCRPDDLELRVKRVVAERRARETEED
jgi:tetratricopeptide (TPR) repeat protein